MEPGPGRSGCRFGRVRASGNFNVGYEGQGEGKVRLRVLVIQVVIVLCYSPMGVCGGMDERLVVTGEFVGWGQDITGIVRIMRIGESPTSLPWLGLFWVKIG